MAPVTDLLLRLSRFAAIILGVVGVSLAITLYLVGDVSGGVAFGLAAYAVACVTVTLPTRHGAAPRAADGSNTEAPPPPSSADVAVVTDPTPASGDPATEVAAKSATPDLRDPLTRLPVRLLLRDRVEHALARAHRHERPVAIMLLDIDGFRGINDAFGYAAGDRVLAAVAARLASTLRGGDTASRLGADEFGLLLEDMADESNFVKISESVIEAL